MTVLSVRRKLPSRVIKVGGSLLQFEGLLPAFRDWHDAQPPAIDVLIAGGGELTNVVRELDQRFALEQITVHWLCVRLMDVTARILHLLFPDAKFLDRSDELRAMLSGPQPRLLVFSAEEFLQHHEPSVPGHRLPTDWSSTSDSIAARLAHAIGATELVLLKSASLPFAMDRHAAAQQGYVDSFFPLASMAVPRIRCVNLRSADEFVIG